MDASLPLLFAFGVGFSHAFEADHLVAVSNIVTRRDRLMDSLKDGIYWGMGHTSTILLIGMVMIIGRATFLEGYFGYFEAGVGLMLIGLGIFRLRPLLNKDREGLAPQTTEHGHDHKLAYGVGLIHGLAGSGALVLLVMTELSGTVESFLYLSLFGIGSVVGMLTAASILGLPFTQKLTTHHGWRQGLAILSSVLCIGYGAFVMYENLMA
jgi:cytochrome c biogenesis protein CcdA